MYGKIKWLSNKVQLEKRSFLFCFENKCMSGRVSEITQSDNENEYEILVEFIEPDYFKNELIIGNLFTINEASKILGKGEVNEITESL